MSDAERLAEAIAIIEAIIDASDQCRGHADCGHSMEPWQRARRFLASEAEPPRG